MFLTPEFPFAALDIGLLALAAAVTLVAAFAGTNMLRSAQRHSGNVRAVWTSIAALAIGLGIWASHFLGVLAWRHGVPISFDPRVVDMSLLTAIALGGAGAAIAVPGRSLVRQLFGGAVIGLAAACMHYAGTAALGLGGPIGWNGTLIVVALVIGMVLGGLSLVITLRGRVWAGTALLTTAICGTQLTLMLAADLSQAFPVPAIDRIAGDILPLGVLLVSLLVLSIAIGSVALDQADRLAAQSELSRQLADKKRIDEVTVLLELATTHMAQGLCLFDSAGRLQFNNTRVAELIRPQPGSQDLIGDTFREFSIALEATVGDLTPAGRAEAEQHVDAVLAKIAKGEVSESLRLMNDGRIVRFLHNPIADGGWVTTIDDVTVQQRSQLEIARLAHLDTLTNILNRTAFNEQLDMALEQAKAADLSFAVIAIDLDKFKDINDSHGHAVGDQVLKAIATRLSADLKNGEIVARLGGDEFVALKMFTSMDSLREFLARIEFALFARIEIEPVIVNTVASIGVAIFPQDGEDRSRLLNNSNLAMHRAKAEYEQSICYYQADMDEQARLRRSMEQDLWAAIENGDFNLVYQVQKSVTTNQVTGYEALLRWDRPGHGMVSPDLFIPVAEECGAINAIGTWVLRTVCSAATKWPEPHKVAVNVSGVQLGQIDLIETVREVLLQTGLAPSRLELEVTETSIIAHKQRALHILREIKEMGVSVSLDDFGTGYSSIDTLRSFPFDKIKIDRSFMGDVDVNEQSRAIVRAILALGHSLSIPVLAEGVETEAQLAVLLAEGCSEAQGYLFGRPGDIEWSSVTKAPRRQRRATAKSAATGNAATRAGTPRASIARR